MTADKSTSNGAIRRTFRDLSNEEVADIEKASFLARGDWYEGFNWDTLLNSMRVLIVSEAGAGKTFECRERQKLLWEVGEPAFFIELTTLATTSLYDSFSPEEQKRFDVWANSQSEIATFFLDSIDELNLTLVNFEGALKKFSNIVTGKLERLRLIITTRPIPHDRALIEKYLPMPFPPEPSPTADSFAEGVMGKNKSKKVEDENSKTTRCVGLMPLSNEQIRNFAIIQDVGDVDALMEDLQNRDAFEFAQRPQDLIELCDDWRQHHRIRTHQEQVEQNVTNKLKPRTERREKAQLSVEKAMEGASRLALAATLTRKLTLRYSVDATYAKASEAALDVSKVLHDWNAEEQATLLERPLFGFATYGRVRFHHRSVIEYLAAKRLETFIADGKSIKSVKRLLFVETAQRNRIVRPSMQPIAAWLGLWRDSIFDEIVALDPSVFLDDENGDPQSLTPLRRTRALEAYVARYGKGGWRGLNTPRIQVHRFASPELGPTVKKLWQAGIENEEVRYLLLAIIGAGKLQDCSDIAYELAMTSNVNVRERGLAVDALLQLKDNRLERISKSVETDPENWPNTATRQTTIDLFPTHMPVDRLIKILSRVQEDKRAVGDLNYRLPRKIESEIFAPAYLDELRQALHVLIVEEIAWKAESYPHLQTLRPDLVISLIAVCRRQLAQKIRTLNWISSCTLAIRLSKDTQFDEKATIELRIALSDLAPDEREAAFFAEHDFLRGLYVPGSLWNHVYDLSQHGGIEINRSKDSGWVRKQLSDKNQALEVREMMLWAEMILLNRPEINYGDFLNSLMVVVLDAPSLLKIIDERLKPHPENAELQRLEKKIANQNKKHESEQAKDHASWVEFWNEISENGSAVFNSESADNTAWNLWRATKNSGDESRESGWNRLFIERQFGKDVADRLRQTMIPLWRKDRPTLRSERPDSEKGTYLVRWQFGLAAISAEAEDRDWAGKISREEAELACRYVPLQLNGFPYWLEHIAVSHCAAVDNILGDELSKSLHESGVANSHSFFLQDLSYASSTVVSLFLSRIQSWLIEVTSNNLNAAEQDIENAVKILLKIGRSEERALLESLSRQKLNEGWSVPHAKIWLPIMMQLNSAEGLKFLEVGLQRNSETNAITSVEWFATLFGKDRHGIGVDLSSSNFTPEILLKLLRLAYQHVRVNDDVHHEGVFSPDTRDDAEGARGAVLGALLATTGPEGWAAKLALIDDPLFDHMKDRIAALAEHKAALEADSDFITEAEYIRLDEYGESSPSTTEAMFALMLDRLDDIDDLLLQDVSPREAWAGFTDERVLRRELARELDNRKNNAYRVDQEAVTADEKETDIRLRATSSNQQGVIELKLGEKSNWTAAKLRETLKEQLLKKYMAAEDCRAGILVVSIASNRGWEHPDTKVNLDFEGLIAMLNDEVSRLMSQHGGSIKLLTKGLDLRPRLA